MVDKVDIALDVSNVGNWLNANFAVPATSSAGKSNLPLDPAAAAVDALPPSRYGLNGRYELCFSTLVETRDDLVKIVLLPRPDVTPPWQRRSLRLAAEDTHFKKLLSHYNTVDDPVSLNKFQSCLAYRPKAPAAGSLLGLGLGAHPIEPGECDTFGVMDVADNREVLFDVVAVLYALQYVKVASAGAEVTCCIALLAALCPPLCFLDHMRSVRDAITSVYRRSLLYSPCISLRIADHALANLVHILASTRVGPDVQLRVLAMIIETRDAFSSDVNGLAVHCDLLLDGLVAWTRHVNTDLFDALGLEIDALNISLADVELDMSHRIYHENGYSGKRQYTKPPATTNWAALVHERYSHFWKAASSSSSSESDDTFFDPPGHACALPR